MTATAKLTTSGFLATAIVALALLLSASSAQASGPPAIELRNGAEIEATFADPNQFPNRRDRTVVDRLRALIRDVPKGESMRLAFHSLSLPGVRDDVLAARRKGVKVQVIYDASKRNAVVNGLARKLRKRFRFCRNGDDRGTKRLEGSGCISTHRSGIMHSKLALFSATKNTQGVLKRNVTWIGSANMTTNSGLEPFNNAITIYDDPALHGGLNRGVFDLAWAQSFGSADFYAPKAGRGYIDSPTSRSTVFASPDQGSDDFVRNRLLQIRKANGCQVRVMHASFTNNRLAVARRLAELRRGVEKGQGCDVRVVVGRAKGRPNMGGRVRATLCGAGVPVKTYPRVHDKAIFSSSPYNGPMWKKMVFTGSHNLTGPALRQNDELFLRLSDVPVIYDGFMRHFNLAYDSVGPKARAVCNA